LAGPSLRQLVSLRRLGGLSRRRQSLPRHPVVRRQCLSELLPPSRRSAIPASKKPVFRSRRPRVKLSPLPRALASFSSTPYQTAPFLGLYPANRLGSWSPSQYLGRYVQQPALAQSRRLEQPSALRRYPRLTS